MTNNFGHYKVSTDPTVKVAKNGTKIYTFSISWYQGKDKPWGIIWAKSFVKKDENQTKELQLDSLKKGEWIVIESSYLDMWEHEQKKGYDLIVNKFYMVLRTPENNSGITPKVDVTLEAAPF